MLNFCTLFDSFYLSRGMALYESLQRHCTNFHLYIFAFDDDCYQFFCQRQVPNITVIPLKKFEDDKLLAVKQTRSKGEYCWTCTPATILYVLDNYQVDECTYVDADLYFFSSPQVLVDEIGDASILLTEHRYTKEYDQTANSGKYCVQFMLFKNDERGRAALTWWRDRCLEWCYNRVEEGKFGDQKYLDDWTERFEGVHVLKNLGGGVAPWNMQQYTFNSSNGIICGCENVSNRSFYLVFFHFHGVQFISPNHSSLPFIYKVPCCDTFFDFFRLYILNIKKARGKYPLIMRFERYYNIKQLFLYIIRIVYHKRIKQEWLYFKSINGKFG